MPHNWTRPGTNEPIDPPVIEADENGVIFVQLDGSYGGLSTDGNSITWYVDAIPLVPAGEDAYPALDVLFSG